MITHSTLSGQPLLYTTPKEAWEAMYRDCEAATQSIVCEQYIFRDDAIGQRFLTLFADKAKQGVGICIVIDALGGRRLIGSSLIANLRKAGGNVRFYNPLNWWKMATPWRWLPRNHKKIMIIDGQIGYIGSACLADDMSDWRDLHVRFTGSVVEAMERDVHAVCRLRAHRMPKSKHDPSAQIYYHVSRPRLRTNPQYRELLSMMRQAQHSIDLVTPYFLPPRRLMSALRSAARRGVTVRVMAGEVTDVSIADRVSDSYIPWLLRNGIQLLLYQKQVLHAKYAVIDGRWAMLGSTNLDYLSLMSNREANVMIRDLALIKRLQAQFEHDKKQTVLVDTAYWHAIPLLQLAIGFIGRSIKRFL